MRREELRERVSAALTKLAAEPCVRAPEEITEQLLDVLESEAGEVEWGISFSVTYPGKFSASGYQNAGLSREVALEMLNDHQEGWAAGGVVYGPAKLVKRRVGEWEDA